LVDRLAARIRDGLGFGDGTGIRSVADVSTSSLDAYRLYAQGIDAYAQWRFDEAEDMLKKALAVDPDFAEAYLQLSSIALIRSRTVERAEYLRAATKWSGRLSERNRLYLEFLVAREEEQIGKAASLIVELLDKFPDFEDAYPFVAMLDNMGEQPVLGNEKTLAIARTGVATLPQSTQVRNAYGYALLRLEGTLTRSVNLKRPCVWRRARRTRTTASGMRI
jgi:tetratricopeptide (TPR) repeat protein